jgi:mitotic spindle assembly checkpoint protein MAD2B
MKQHPQAWIPSEPNLQPKGKGREVDGEDLGGVRTRPIRSVEAGPLFFECWVEEGKAKEVLMRMMEAEGASQGSTQPF